MRLDRKSVHLFKTGVAQAEASATMTKSEAFAFVWELTQEVFSLSRRYNVQSRLQRHVVSVTRKQS